MASSHQKGNGHSMYISISPHFFKIILRETLRDGKLGIPKEFIKKYGNGMSSPALLRVPSGEVWKVGLRKIDGKVWLENGWREFANHYSLEHGHFLVFRYEGNCNFHVVILNRTASEIEYPYTRNYQAQFKEIPAESETEDDDSQILEDISPSTKNREKLDLHCPRPHKKMRMRSTMHTGCPTIRGDKKVFALQRAARAYKSENPFFVLVMQPSYVGLKTKCRLILPTDFVRKHLMKEDCEIILCNSEGKTWPVIFHRRGEGHSLYASLKTGWPSFVQDNNVQLGDVCAFELTNCIEISFKVVKAGNCHDLSASSDAFGPVKEKARASSPSQRCSESLNALEKAKALQLASVFRSENPSFTVVMQPTYIYSTQMSVPERFARRHLRKMLPQILHEVVLRLSNGKSWPVEYYQQSTERPSTKFRGGWKKFVLDNNLEVGNVCIFELAEGTQTSFKVTIHRKPDIEDANCESSCAESGANQVKFERKESLEINAPSNSLHNKGDISSLQNQHLTEELPVPMVQENDNVVSGETLNDF